MLHNIGIIGNTQKANIGPFSAQLAAMLTQAGFACLICDDLTGCTPGIAREGFRNVEEIGDWCDMLLSLGGDGTMLSTSSVALRHQKPVAGLNFGKLGFLAEVDTTAIEGFITALRTRQYSIEDRMVLTATATPGDTELLAINDIVIDKGGWSKMVSISISVNGEFVTTFSADGVVIATPTGSTGYSLSAGGSIISPRADVIAISPISPHSLTMRPIVLPGADSITLRADSAHTVLQVNCDGQRSHAVPPPLTLTIAKSNHPLQLLRPKGASYFATLRNKLFWGMDLRNKEEQQP